MDTREKRPPQRKRRPANKKAAPPAPSRRRREEAGRPARRPVRKHKRQERVVRPPRADVPEVVYTMPRPLKRGKFLLRLASVVAAVVAVMMALSVFFRVDTVTVLGAEKYTPWAIREVSGIVDGEGLLTLSKARAAGRIKAALPYVDEVKIDLKLPGTVSIEIRELDVVYAVAAEDDRWWLISADGTAIEPVDGAAASGHTQVFGLRIAAPTAGSPIAAASAAPETEPTEETEATEEPAETEETGATEATEATAPTAAAPEASDAQRLSAVLTILQSMEQNGIIGKVDSINVENLLDIRLNYDQGLNVRLGNSTRLDYKIEYLAKAVRQMEQYQTGVFDLTFEHAEYGILDPEQ